LTFVVRETSALAGKASWILRFRCRGRSTEKVLGHYPDLTPREAREIAWQVRKRLQRGIDVAVAKLTEKARPLGAPAVNCLDDTCLARYIEPRYKHLEVVARTSTARPSRTPRIDRSAPRSNALPLGCADADRPTRATGAHGADRAAWRRLSCRLAAANGAHEPAIARSVRMIHASSPFGSLF
jgi:hypothetical protein